MESGSMMTGAKRHRCAIQRNTSTQDEFGQDQESWATIATRWGQVKPMSSKELVASNQVQSNATHEVKLRYDSSLNLTAKDRILYDGRFLNIESIINVGERNKEYVLICKEETN